MLKVLELFGGIGACTAAIKRLNIPYEVVDYVEIDKYAVKSYNAMNDTNFEPQDITKWDKDIDVDLIIQGSPCQDFSLAGTQEGGDENSGTRSSLMYETVRIVNKLNPKYVVWENVKNVLSKTHKHNFDKYIKYLSDLGYNNYWKVLNAKDYGIPQNRERIFVVSIRKDIDDKMFKFDELIECVNNIESFLENEDVVSHRYYGLTDLQRKMFTSDGNGIKRYVNSNVVDKFGLYQVADISFPNGYNKGPRVHDYCPTINNTTTKSSFIIKTSENPMVIRRFTVVEIWRLMGFNDEEIDKVLEVNTEAQMFKQAGNSIVVNVLEALLKELLLK
ncbi:MAG: DNA cytosine methyltransferase [Bacilli bacterium]|nr:DNA cytosine methyltransferase [Bacilli bacterium]